MALPIEGVPSQRVSRGMPELRFGVAGRAGSPRLSTRAPPDLTTVISRACGVLRSGSRRWADHPGCRLRRGPRSYFQA